MTELNRAVRVLGTDAEPKLVINQIRKKYFSSDSDLMALYGITFDGSKYKFRDWQYEQINDAINSAERTLELGF